MRREIVVVRGEPRSLVYHSCSTSSEATDELNDALPENQEARMVEYSVAARLQCFWAVWLLPSGRPLAVPRLVEIIVPVDEGVLEAVRPEDSDQRIVRMAFRDMGSDARSAKVYAAWLEFGVDVAAEVERRMRRGQPELEVC